METILRTAGVYVFLIILFRLIGKRSLASADTFDMVVLLIISEATQEAMIGEDYSLTAAFLSILTLLTLTVLLAFVKQKSRTVDMVLDGAPLLVMDDGKMLEDRMKKVRVDEEDILEAAQLQHGLARLDEVRYVILQRNGELAVIPREGGPPLGDDLGA